MFVKNCLKLVSLMLAVCFIVGCTTPPAADSAPAPTAAPAAAAPAAPAIEIPEEPIEIVDAASLAMNGLRSMQNYNCEMWSVYPEISADGTLGTDAGEFPASMTWSNSMNFVGEEWSSSYWYMITLAGKLEMVNEEFYIVDGTHYYKNFDHAAFTKGDGIVPVEPSGVPAKQLLEMIAAGTYEAEYSATPEEGHVLSFVLTGDMLKQTLKEYFPLSVGKDGIPEEFDWNAIKANAKLTFSSYNGCPDELTIDCPELAALIFVSQCPANYMIVKEHTLCSSANFGIIGMSTSNEQKMAVPGTIPQPTTLKDVLAKAFESSGINLSLAIAANNSNKQEAAEQQGIEPPAAVTSAPAVVTPAPAVATPAPAAATEVPAAATEVPAAPAPADGFVVPETFTEVQTDGDITLYLDDGRHVNLGFPSGVGFYKGTEYRQQGTYYAMIIHDMSKGSGNTKLTLMDVNNMDQFIVDRMNRELNYVKQNPQNTISYDLSDVMIETFNGLEVHYAIAKRQSINSFKKQVFSTACYAIAKVNDVYLALELSSSANKDGVIDFNPAEVFFSLVK